MGHSKTRIGDSDPFFPTLMKTRLRSSGSLKFLVVLATVSLLAVGGLFARYVAFVYWTGGESFGAYGLSWNCRTANAAVNSAVSTATYYNGGPLNGYRFAWWRHRGYEAGARGFNYDASYVKFGWARGWSTRNGAINYAVGRLGYNTYSLGYASGYNR